MKRSRDASYPNVLGGQINRQLKHAAAKLFVNLYFLLMWSWNCLKIFPNVVILNMNCSFSSQILCQW